MRKVYKRRTYKLEQKKRKFTNRDTIQILLLFIILITWLFVRILNYKIGKAIISEAPTMERLLEIALQPIGNTMYIWGGGWDVEDKQSGAGSTTIGVSPIWKEFAQKQDATYNYEDYRYERELGLDCSGYVGWVVYNLFETEAGKEGYVTFSTEMAETFANRGWGKFYKNPNRFLAGDIVSMDGHVWICLGTCADGSVLLIHSSPPGVSVCGTETPSKNLESSNEDNEISAQKSIAVYLAETFMENYYPKWQATYPNRSVSTSYLKDVTVMRWNTQTLSDARIYQGMSGEEILQILDQFAIINE